MLDISCSYCGEAIHPGHIDTHKEKCEFRNMDAIQLKTPLMEIKTHKGNPVSINWIKQTITEQHDFLLNNPDEPFMYSTTGQCLIFTHRADGEITTYITKIQGVGYMGDQVNIELPSSSEFRSIDLEE